MRADWWGSVATASNYDVLIEGGPVRSTTDPRLALAVTEICVMNQHVDLVPVVTAVINNLLELPCKQYCHSTLPLAHALTTAGEGKLRHRHLDCAAKCFCEISTVGP
jgi:hypothetical protein